MAYLFSKRTPSDTNSTPSKHFQLSFRCTFVSSSPRIGNLLNYSSSSVVFHMWTLLPHLSHTKRPCSGPWAWEVSLIIAGTWTALGRPITPHHLFTPQHTPRRNAELGLPKSKALASSPILGLEKLELEQNDVCSTHPFFGAGILMGRLDSSVCSHEFSQCR